MKIGIITCTAFRHRDQERNGKQQIYTALHCAIASSSAAWAQFSSACFYTLCKCVYGGACRIFVLHHAGASVFIDLRSRGWYQRLQTSRIHELTGLSFVVGLFARADTIAKSPTAIPILIGQWSLRNDELKSHTNFSYE